MELTSMPGPLCLLPHFIFAVILQSIHRSVMYGSFYPMDCSPPGSSVHGILQVRILEWVAISFSKILQSGSFYLHFTDVETEAHWICQSHPENRWQSWLLMHRTLVTNFHLLSPTTPLHSTAKEKLPLIHYQVICVNLDSSS